MARAKRYFIPGYVWHISHRCHKKDFLLKFSKDRDRWLHWLFQAKKRHGLHVLNYMATSNHIHLLVIDQGERGVIPNSIKLIAGRVAQEYNVRKKRKGAFWEDRYHATAIQTGRHLIQCLVYIDLNMVRAGVVSHPSQWAICGYNEIQNPKERYGIIDFPCLMNLLNINCFEKLKESHYKWVAEGLKKNDRQHVGKWTESVGVGSKNFLETVKEKLGHRARGRNILEDKHSDSWQLREDQSAYGAYPQNDITNGYFWDI